MPLLVRRLFFYFLVALFIVSVPIIVGYTAGYRYSFKQNKLVKTGLMIIESNPKGAKIFLNDRLRTERTPAYILNLTPSNYEITLRREGYHSWSKTLAVESEKTTFAIDILLIKDAQPQLLAESNMVDFYALDHDDSIFAIEATDALYELKQVRPSLNTANLLWRGSLSSSPTIEKFQNRPRRLLIKSGNYSLASIEDDGTRVSPITLPTANKNADTPVIDKIKFRPDGRLLMLSQKILYSNDPISDNINKIADSIEDFDLAGPKILTISARDGISKLTTLSDDPANVAVDLAADNYRFLAISGDFAVLRELKSEKIVLIDLAKNTIVAELEGASALWQRGEKPTLFTFSPHEVWQFDPQKNEAKLIIRLLEEIHDVIPLPQGPTVILALENKIQAVELDLRDKQNIWDLANFENIKKAALSQDGKQLLILGKRDGKNGLWQLDLR